MSDTDHNDDGFEEAFTKGLGDDPTPETSASKEPETPPAEPGAVAEPPKKDEAPKPAEEPKKDDDTPPAKPEEPEGKKPETPPADPEKKPEEGDKKPEAPEAPKPPEESKAPEPLTKDDVTSLVKNIQTEERNSSKLLDTTTEQVVEAYYPNGLSNVLVDEKSGKELKTPQDVVDASGGEMSIEDAAQWLMNEQFKLDKQINDIKSDARKVAETTINFKRDSIAAVQKYEPLFKVYPQLQAKVFDKMMKLVKDDKEKNVILSAPDVMEFYDDYLEPYQQAFEFGKNQPATNPTPPPEPETPPAKPSADDRLDDTGDGAPSEVDDPNNFGQQVVKELAKGL